MGRHDFDTVMVTDTNMPSGEALGRQMILGYVRGGKRAKRVKPILDSKVMMDMPCCSQHLLTAVSCYCIITDNASMKSTLDSVSRCSGYLIHLVRRLGRRSH